MTYTLAEEKEINKKIHRLYRNPSGSEVKTVHIYTDKDGGKWFGFVDLFKIPVMRISMAQHIANLYGLGLTKKDLDTWIGQEKTLLKGNDPEKYEKLYSLILEKERVINFTADPVKQSLALCTVYIMRDDERIDYFDEEQAEQKLKIWRGMPEAIGFFLNWHNDHIRNYMKDLNRISEIASNLQEKQINRQ